MLFLLFFHHLVQCLKVLFEILYKRFLGKGVKYLIDEANLNYEDKVLDICGGNGRLTRELKRLCKNVSYLDQEKDMIPEDLQGNHNT